MKIEVFVKYAKSNIVRIKHTFVKGNPDEFYRKMGKDEDILMKIYKKTKYKFKHIVSDNDSYMRINRNGVLKYNIDAFADISDDMYFCKVSNQPFLQYYEIVIELLILSGVLKHFGVDLIVKSEPPVNYGVRL